MRDFNVLDTYGKTFPLILADMKRYNNRIKLKSESIAEHSFFVAYNIIKVGYDYSIPNDIVNEAVSIAIAHDYPEVFTSDLPHDCKQRYPELRKLLAVVELDFIKDEMPELYSRYSKLICEESLVTLLVDIGDAISVLQFCNRETELGNNTDDIKNISNEIKMRVVTLFEKLKKELADYAEE